ncbi:MAG: DsbA family protein [bacterium]|nr:DsbA family protein [bacterium]
MNDAPKKSSSVFLLVSIVLGVFIVFGLIWAVSSGSSNGSGTPGTFNDEKSPRIGAENPELVIHVFEDFECPACRSAEVGFRHALKTYGDRVQFVWKDFPLQSIHRNALSGANAARCAQEQGKFWEFHDRLYDDQPTWGELPDPTTTFTNYASALALDVDAWSSCYSERRYQADVLSDVSEANGLRLNGTPTSFIGDKVFSQVLSPSDWDREIQSALTTK